MQIERDRVPGGECEDGGERGACVWEDGGDADEDLPKVVAEKRADGGGGGHQAQAEVVPTAGGNQRCEEGQGLLLMILILGTIAAAVV